MKKLLAGIILIAAAGAGALAYTGHLSPLLAQLKHAQAAPKAPAKETAPAAIAVTVSRVVPEEFVETALVTGTIVAREEILVGPEIEGLRVVEVLADEGDRVRKGQVLARLVSDTLDAQLAQSGASLARANAAMAQAKSNIASAEARLMEARNSYERGKPLKNSGFLSESGMDQRQAAAMTAEAQLAAAKDGLKVAEAEKAQIEAQRRELDWKRERTEVMAPADGIVSRRMARVGAFASGAAEPMFRIIAKGEVELDAEVAEARLSRVRPAQTASVDVAGAPPVDGKVRLVSPEIDRATRMGRVRVFVGDNPAVRVGAFGRGTIVTARGRGLAIPASAVLHGAEGATVQVVRGGLVSTRRVTLGLEANALVEVREGLADGDLVVTKSGTFLRDGDLVRPVFDSDRRISDAR